MTRLLAGWLAQVALMAALILGPAWVLTGGVDWPRGWLALGILAAAIGGGGVWVMRTSPALFRERASVELPSTAADRRATALILLTMVSWFPLAAWDALRGRVLPLPTALALAVGVTLFVAGLGIILWTFHVNAFAATVVKVQAEQRVIASGPYAWVRHPMYAGALLWFAGLGLILGATLAALLAPPLFALAFVPRMRAEEVVLRRELAGYAAYQARVRTRLLPGVW